MKIPVANLSEQTKLEAGIGFTSGILVGAVASWILIIFFTPWQWYFKVFSSVGSLGIIGSLWMSLNEQIKARRLYIAAMKEMNSVISKTSQPQTPNITAKAGDSSFPAEITGTKEEEVKKLLNKDIDTKELKGGLN